MSLTKTLSSLASAGLLAGCAIGVPVPVITEQPNVTEPKVQHTTTTSVTGVAAPMFNSLPAAPSPNNAEVSTFPVATPSVTPIAPQPAPAAAKPVVKKQPVKKAPVKKTAPAPKAAAKPKCAC